MRTKDKDKWHVVVSLSAFDSNGNLADCKDMSHLFRPPVRTFALVMRFGIPTILWGFRTSRKNFAKIMVEISIDEAYASRTYVRTEHGWERV